MLERRRIDHPLKQPAFTAPIESGKHMSIPDRGYARPSRRGTGVHRPTKHRSNAKAPSKLPRLPAVDPAPSLYRTPGQLAQAKAGGHAVEGVKVGHTGL